MTKSRLLHWREKGPIGPLEEVEKKVVDPGDHLQLKMMNKVTRMIVKERGRENPDLREKILCSRVNLVKYLQGNHKVGVNKEEIKAS